jgi:parvulin-like peptidyl-prolyl isomerase
MGAGRPLLAFVGCTVFLALAPPACGGQSSEVKAPAEEGVQLKDTSAARCLETAGAKRQRKAEEPAKVSVKHLLVKYAGAKSAPATIKRTREEACLRALEARNKLEQGSDFSALVKEYSEEPGAATRDGSLGTIQRSDVVPPFADAAFELDLNQASDVVETDFGFHVILRTE